MTQRQASYYLRRIYRVLEDPDLSRKLKKLSRYWDEETGQLLDVEGMAGGNEIEVDPRNATLVAACIHEPLHILYPGWSHRRINPVSTQIANAISMKQWHNLIFRWICTFEPDRGT